MQELRNENKLMGSLTDIGYIKEVMEAHGIAFKKEFGQNFLINPDIPRRIAECVDGNVIEIGPGVGCLTRELSVRCKKVVSLEIDRGLIPVLDDTLSDCENVKVINQDVMQTDMSKLWEEEFGREEVSICANLPYNITTPVIMKLLEFANEHRPFKNIVVMVQLEVAQRLTSNESSPLFGAITASASYYAKISRLFNVNAGNFMPKPKVDSAVISLKPYDDPPVDVKDRQMLMKVIRGGFAQRRKTLNNSLRTEFSNFSKEQLGDIIRGCGFDENVRGEKLSLADYAKLANALTEK